MTVPPGGIIDEIAVLIKAGAMAGTVPAVLHRIPVQGASHMRAPFYCRREKVQGRDSCVNKQLSGQHISLGRKDRRKAIAAPQNHIRQYFRSDQRSGHAPEMKTGGCIYVGKVSAVRADVRNAVQTDTVLVCPGEFFTDIRIILTAKIPHSGKTAPLQASSVIPAAHQQEIAVISQIYTAFIHVLYSSAKIRRIFQSYHIRTLLIKLCKI